MKTFLLGFIAAFLVLPMCALGYYRLGLAEVPSDSRPPAWESWLMHSAVRASVRRNASGLRSQIADNNDEALTEGRKLYLNGCAGCHGDPGKPREDLSHYPPVPQFAHVGTRYTEPEAYWVIKHGIRMTAMSAYGPFYSDHEMWALARFVSRIKALPQGVVERIQPKQASTSP
jgi:mono/diheme cytochrome c family protein